MSWPKVKIGDLVESISKWNPKASPSAPPFTYIDLSSIDKERKLIHEVVTVQPSEAPSRARQLVQENDVLVSTVRPNLNGVAMIGPEYDGATASTGYCVLRPIPEKILPSFLFHWVKTSHFISEMTRNSTGANYPAVSDKTVKQYLISLPPIDEQKRITNILDKANEIRNDMKPIANLRDSLVISTFYAMFNITKDGEYDWPNYTLNELVLPVKGSMRDGPFGSNLKSSDFVEHGVKVIRTQNLKKTGYVDQNVAYISSEKAEELAKYEFEPGDLVIAKLGKYPGVAAVIPESCGSGIIPADIVRFRGKPELINHYYLAAFLNSAVGTRQISRHFRGSTRTRVNLTALREIQIAVPPLELQEEFERIVNHVKAIPSGQLLTNLFSKSIYQEILI